SPHRRRPPPLRPPRRTPPALDRRETRRRTIGRAAEVPLRLRYGKAIGRGSTRINIGSGRIKSIEDPLLSASIRVDPRQKEKTRKVAESACKPGSVVDSHSSGRSVTATLEQPTRT